MGSWIYLCPQQQNTVGTRTEDKYRSSYPRCNNQTLRTRLHGDVVHIRMFTDVFKIRHGLFELVPLGLRERDACPRAPAAATRLGYAEGIRTTSRYLRM